MPPIFTSESIEVKVIGPETPAVGVNCLDLDSVAEEDDVGNDCRDDDGDDDHDHDHDHDHVDDDDEKGTLITVLTVSCVFNFVSVHI